jgi:hypothetical protein
MRTTGTKRAIRIAFFRLGLHTTSKAIVEALAKQGIPVTEELVCIVRIEMLKKTTRANAGKVARPVPPPAVRRRPQAFPGRRGR